MQRELAAHDAALTLEQALAMAWNGGAGLSQPGRLGRVTAGQLADLVILGTDGPHQLGDPHPAPALALRAIPGDARTLILDGRVVADNHHLLTTDEQQTVDEACVALQIPARHAPV